MSGLTTRSDARANRQRLIAAAQDVFRENGIDAEMKVIAERAGVGVGTIYRNFPTKDDLITAITAELVDAVRIVCDEATQTEDPADAIRVFVDGALRIIDQYGDVVVATKQRGLPPACHQLFVQLDARGQIMNVIQKGIDSGRFRADVDAEVVATLIEASFFPPSYKSLRQTRTHKQVTDALTDFFLRGMLAS